VDEEVINLLAELYIINKAYRQAYEVSYDTSQCVLIVMVGDN